MNITKEQIKEWMDSSGIKFVNPYDLAEAIEQCFNDLAPKIEARAVLNAAMELDLYSVNCSDTGINVGDELALYANKKGTEK